MDIYEDNFAKRRNDASGVIASAEDIISANVDAKIVKQLVSSYVKSELESDGVTFDAFEAVSVSRCFIDSITIFKVAGYATWYPPEGKIRQETPVTINLLKATASSEIVIVQGFETIWPRR